MTTILYLILLLGGEPWRDGLGDVAVRFEPYSAHYTGLACAPKFREVEGNTQALCPDGFEGVILYANQIHDRAFLLNVLRHEDYHLSHPYAGPPDEDDLFDEAGAYRAGCAYSYIESCPTWLADHQEVRP